MKRNFYGLSILSFIFFGMICSCSQKEETSSTTSTITPTPTFILSNNKENMPVWVYGKSDANCILLAVHGGPGSDVLDFRNIQEGLGFKKIEEQYLVAYWQQRASGQSYGVDDNLLFTIDQYVEDLDKVIDQLTSRYPNKKIALLGHSWGGMLTSSYLKNDTRKAKIHAWIDAAGATDGTTLLNSTKDDLIAEVDARIAKNQNVENWQEVKTMIQDPQTNLNALAYLLTDIIPEVTTKVDKQKMIITERGRNSNASLFPVILTMDNSASLANFNKPTLILWGQYDFAVSKKIRDKAIKYLPANQVTSVLFEASGHYMMFHEPTLFAQSIISFLQKL